MTNKDCDSVTDEIEVILGGSTIKAFVAAPKGYDILGIVRRGMEYGLLATNKKGAYVKVNGSQIENVCSELILDAMAKCIVDKRGMSFAEERANRKGNAIVVYKKRKQLGN